MYSKNYAPTTGVDFYLKRTTVAASRNCALKLWDISGKAMQGRMLDKYVFGEPRADMQAMFDGVKPTERTILRLKT